jgi:N-acetyl-gamma-glutamyl-phosphate reductase
MIRTAIVGASGYTGLELLRLLACHPETVVTAVTSRQLAGQKITRVFPALAGRTGGLDNLAFEPPVGDDLAGKADVVFTAVPHHTAMEIVPGLVRAGLKVIDLSADFRLKSADVYAAWYGPHTAADLLTEAVYGLPELYREAIGSARLVGNPGCYPTSIILALAPLLAADWVDPGCLIADSKSGVSGAGRGASLGTSFCEVDGGFTAYKVAGHRHVPEMEQELGRLAGQELRLTFTPHLLPMSRGILSTVYGRLVQSVTTAQALDQFVGFYQNAPFVRIRPAGDAPHTLDVRGTNYCDLGVFVDERTGWIKVVSAIDNLTRGASGQAVCNMNLMTGLAEETGLTGLGLRP